ncbi:MAG: peptidoglycan DD-metalloendopeptidase family protein [Nitriliruptorales bacterium]|nr:peptidoglycan DD-metalloendopeptidase family protein [Nitriliruptorales bacterium]
MTGGLVHLRAALRRSFLVLLTVVPLACAALPALAGDREEFEAQRDAWTRNQELLADTSANLEEVDTEAGQAADDIAQVQQRLQDAQDRLDRLRERLTRATRRLRAAEHANDTATVALGQEIRSLGAMEDAVEQHAGELEVQVVAAYKYGGSSAQFRGVLDVVLKSDSLTEFTTAYEQLRSSTVNQKQLMDDVTALAEQLFDQRARVAAMQRETQRAQRAAAAERRGIAALTVEQETVVIDMRRDRQELRELLTQLRDRQEEDTRRIAQLETASDTLYDQLRQYRYLGAAPGANDLLWPTDGPATSGFGFRTHPIFKTRRLHAGIDIPAPTGQLIYAAADGRVLSAGPHGGYGNAVVIDHGEGLTTVYAHQSSILISTGDEVSGGDTIGVVGSTGQSTGPHLHFEVRQGGTPVDPLDWY